MAKQKRNSDGQFVKTKKRKSAKKKKTVAKKRKRWPSPY